MSISVDAKGFIEKAFDSFKKITPGLLALAISTGLILFLPESILEKMSLNKLSDNWRKVIGIAFIVAVAIIIAITVVVVIGRIGSSFKRKMKSKKLRQMFIELSPEYKQLLVTMLKSDGRVLNLDPYSGDTLYLQSNHFLHQASTMMIINQHQERVTPYTPQAWLIDLYNEEPELFMT